MAKWIGTAASAAALTLSVSTAISPVTAAQAAVQKATISGASDVSAMKHYRRSHLHYTYHPYYPYRYGHPYYYSPGPILPFPSFFVDSWESW